MKKAIHLLLTLGAISIASAMDDFKPLKGGQGQVNLSYQYISYNKIYDKDGKAREFPDTLELSGQVIALELKYGSATNLDIEVYIPFVMAYAKPAGAPAQDESGIGQPEIGLKYLTPEGFGGFVNYTLPLADENIKSDPSSEIELGGLYVLETEVFNLHAMLSYNLTLEVKTGEEPKTKVNPGDQSFVSLRPQLNVTPEFGVFLASNYSMQYDREVEGTKIKDSNGYALTIEPGMNLQTSEMLSIEARSQFVAMGKNAFGGWGLGAKAKVKF